MAIDRETSVDVQRIPERKRGRPRAKQRLYDRAIKAAGFDWYILRVQPGKEARARDFLADRGLDLFLPCDRKLLRTNRFNGMRKQRQVPVLTGYLFVGFDAGRPVAYDALRLGLVHGVVGHMEHGQGRPYRMPTQAMARLLADFPGGLRRADSVALMRKRHEFHKGDRVRPSDGPFAEYIFTAGEIVDDTVLCDRAGLGRVPFPVHVLVPA